MAIAFDDSSFGNTVQTGDTSLTITHTATGSDRYAALGAGIRQITTNIDGFTYDGHPVAEDVTSTDHEVDYDDGEPTLALILSGTIPSTTTNASVVVDIDETRSITMHCATFTGVDQTTPVRGEAQTNGGGSNGTSSDIDVTTVSGDMVADLCTIWNGVGTTLTEDGSQTLSSQTVTSESTANNNNRSAMSYKVATGTTTNMAWSFDSSRYGQMAFAMIPSAAANPKGPLGMPFFGPFGGPI